MAMMSMLLLLMVRAGASVTSSSRGYAMKYGNANFAWHNDEAPSKIIRMGAK